MSDDRIHSVRVMLTAEEKAELERLAPAYGQDDIESFLPTIINAGLRWADADQRRAMRDMKRSVQKLKQEPPARSDDDIPF